MGNDTLLGDPGNDNLRGGADTADNGDGGPDLDTCSEVETKSDCEDWELLELIIAISKALTKATEQLIYLQTDD